MGDLRDHRACDGVFPRVDYTLSRCRVHGDGLCDGSGPSDGHLGVLHLDAAADLPGEGSTPPDCASSRGAPGYPDRADLLFCGLAGSGSIRFGGGRIDHRGGQRRRQSASGVAAPRHSAHAVGQRGGDPGDDPCGGSHAGLARPRDSASAVELDDTGSVCGGGFGGLPGRLGAVFVR